jgi:hypothetical protein
LSHCIYFPFGWLYSLKLEWKRRTNNEWSFEKLELRFLFEFLSSNSSWKHWRHWYSSSRQCHSSCSTLFLYWPLLVLFTILFIFIQFFSIFILFFILNFWNSILQMIHLVILRQLVTLIVPFSSVVSLDSPLKILFARYHFLHPFSLGFKYDRTHFIFFFWRS